MIYGTSNLKMSKVYSLTKEILTQSLLNDVSECSFIKSDGKIVFCGLFFINLLSQSLEQSLPV